MTTLSATMKMLRQAKAYKFKRTLLQNQEPFEVKIGLKISFQLL